MLATVEAELPRVVTERFGSAARVERLQDLTSGAESHVFAFELHEPGGVAQPLVLKLYSGPTAGHEPRLLRALHAQRFPVPELLHASSDGAPFGLPYAIMRRIEGRPLGAALRGAAPEQIASGLRAFAELAVRLHGLDVAPFVAEVKSAGEYLDEELQRYEQALRELEVPEFRPVFDWLLEQRRALAVRGPSLIHQDYHPFNVLVDGRGELHLLDWTIARVTDPRSDLAQTFQMLASSGFSALRAPIVAAYEAASGRPLEDMAFFDVFAALKNVAGQYAVLDDGEHKRPALWARLARRPHFAERVQQLRVRYDGLENTYLRMKKLSGVEVPAAERLFAELRRASTPA